MQFQTTEVITIASDYESGAKKTIDLSIKAEKLTADILKTALTEFIDGRAKKKGRISYRQLEKQADSKLDSIEVSDKNIGDFLKTARKYDVTFAVKQDKIANTYHIFFSASKTDNIKSAISEYVGKMKGQQNRAEFSRNQLKKEASRISAMSRKKHKERTRTRETYR